VEANDVLPTLADKPLAAADDLTKQLKAAGESAVPLKILRAGKPLTIQVRPIYRVTLGPVKVQKAEYYIGVSVDAADDAVRAQLGLPSGQGVVVSEVVKGSPAEKAGIKKYDVLLELGGKPIESAQALARQIQSAQGKPITLTVLRAGKPQTISVTGAIRQGETNLSQESMRLWLLGQPSSPATGKFIFSLPQEPLSGTPVAPTGAGDLRQRLDHVEKELHALRIAVDKVNETLRANKATKRD
jgi:PDZ domain